MDKKLKIASAIGVGVLLLGAGALGGAQLFPKTVEVPVVEYKNVTVTEYKDVIVEKNITKEVPGPVVYKDNDNLYKVMQYIEDNYNEDITVDYIVFETEAQVEAEALIMNEFKSLLKDNDFFEDGEALADYRTSEVSIKKVYDAEIVDFDAENKDLTLSYEVKFRAKVDSEDAEYFNFTIEVPFEDGRMIEEDITVELI